MPASETPRAAARRLLGDGTLGRLVEILAVFAIALAAITVGAPLAGDNPLALQGVVWLANVLMLVAVWLGLKARGQGWEHLGLGVGRFDRGALWRAAWRSLVVFVAALAAFALGSVVGAAVVGIPEPADLSSYNYLSGNLPLLLLSLAGVYIVSSLGEEIIYRGFLITRLTEIGQGGKSAVSGAVLASAVIFGLVHYKWGAMGMVQTGFMGLALGLAYLWTRRNLWVLVLAHAYLDTMLLVPLYFAPSSP